MDSRLLLILIPALPLTGAIVTGLLGARVLKQWSHLPVVATLVAACVCSLMLARQVHERAVAPPGSELIETPDVAGGPVGESTTVGYEEIHVLWTWADIQDAWQSSQPADAAVAAAQSDAGRDFRIDIALRADPLTCIMLVMVTFISSLVAIYASGYMRGDPGYWRFFAYVAIFVFSMTMLVSVSNFLLLFVFWEAVGACSYLLIGFWFEKPSAAAAGKKAFLVNRVGDFGFALALFLIWATYGTWNFHDTPEIHGVLGQARLMDGAFVGGGLGMAICLLLMLGACGKSAQFPLHVWLPDAMEGPTPVSALIHAATMVTAGVYMVTRCTPLFLVSPTAQVTVATIGGFTALLAGLIAITQFDLKRVLAYSTVSQLGYMFLGLGTGTLAGITAGMFHLFTHAFFKALLFLGSGSVMHAMGGIIDMRRFSGLKTKMPITHLTFAIGCLALAGVFPLSGFWSKDAVVASIRDQGLAMQSALHSGSLSEAHLEMHSQANSDPSRSPEARIAGEPLVPSSYVGQPSTASGHPTQEGDHPIGEAGSDAHGDATHEEGHAVTTEHLAHFSHGELACGAAVYPWLYRIALFTALLTAIYTFRAFFMTFYGEEVIPAEAGDHAHESPPSMWLPLVILAAFAVAVGYVLESTHLFADWLAATPSLAYAGVQATPRPAFHPDVAMISSALAVGGIALAAYLYLGNRREAAAIASWLDQPWLLRPYRWSLGKFFIDELYGWTIVKPMEAWAGLMAWVDRWVVDGVVNVTGWCPRGIGSILRKLQIGLVPFYGLAMLVGIVLLAAATSLWGGN